MNINFEEKQERLLGDYLKSQSFTTPVDPPPSG